eukprot:SAG31_NODE_1690_length_7524_cov_2.991919_3_plen_399_part_00
MHWLTNPAPTAMPNGSLLWIYRQAGSAWPGSNASSERLGVATSVGWNATVLQDKSAAAPLFDWAMEDQFVWRDKRGFYHALTHKGKPEGSPDRQSKLHNSGQKTIAGHLFSRDGLHWSIGSEPPYNCTIAFTDGSSITATKRARPQLLVSAGGEPLILATGAQLQGDADFTFTTVQPIHQHKDEAMTKARGKENKQRSNQTKAQRGKENNLKYREAQAQAQAGTTELKLQHRQGPTSRHAQQMREPARLARKNDDEPAHTANDIVAASSRARAAANGTLLMFVADDLGFNDVGWKNPLIKTPTIDALRLKGVTLADYYVQCVCSPTRGSLLSGMFPLNLGYDNVIHDSEPMGVPLDLTLLPQALQKAGFATHLLGKWHIGMFKPALLPINRGMWRGSA